MGWLGHLYGAMWSNMWAPSIPTLLGVVVSHVKSARHREQVAQETREHAERLAGRRPDGAP